MAAPAGRKRGDGSAGGGWESRVVGPSQGSGPPRSYKPTDTGDTEYPAEERPVRLAGACVLKSTRTLLQAALCAA